MHYYAIWRIFAFEADMHRLALNNFFFFLKTIFSYEKSYSFGHLRLIVLLLFFGVALPFSLLIAQDQSLCGTFSATPLTRPPIINGNSSAFGIGLADEVLEISGIFTINTGFEFKNCILKMAPNAIINVTSNQHFEMRNCKVFCCQGMWIGVKIPSDSWVDIWGNTFEDAITTKLLYTFQIDY